MGYYWVTQAQRYIQSLGFGSTLPAVNKRQQLLRINQFGGDNSFYREGTGKLTITLRQGRRRRRRGRRGHRPRVRPLGAGQPGARLRLHPPMPAPSARRSATTSPSPCPSTSRRPPTSRASPTGTRRRTRRRCPHCLRRVDGNKHYPEDLVGEVHADGEIWSRALWDIHKALGAKLADTIIIRAQFGFTPDISMPAAAAEDDRHRGPLRHERRRRRCRRRSPRAGSRSAHAPLQRQGRPRRGGEDQRDHGRQRYTTCPRPDRPLPPADGGMSGRMLDFLAYLEFERGLSRNTLEAYRSDLLQLGAFLGRRGVDAVDVQHARPQRLPVRAGDRRRGPPAGRGRHAAAQGRVPALLLSPPAPRGRARPRPDGRPARAAQEPAPAAGPQPRRGRPPAERAARAPTPRRCAIAPCSSSCTPAACAPRRPSGSTCATSTSRSACCAPAARAPRSAWCPSAARRSRPRRPTSSAAARRSSACGDEPRLFVNRRGGGLTRQGLYKIVQRHARASGSRTA